MTWLRAETVGALGLEAAIAELQAAGVPLPPMMAVLDLRWLQDRILGPGSRTTMPSSRELARRWGWGEKRVRLLLKREEDWSDPRRLDEWRTHRGRTEDARRARRGRNEDAVDDGATPDNDEEGRTEDAPRTHEGRTEDAPGATRAEDLSTLPSPSPSPPEQPTGGGPALEDAPTVEDTTACTMVVRGRVAPDPDAPTELQVAELVALQQTAMPSRADHDAVTRLLVKPGVTAEVARAMWEAAAADDWWQGTADNGEPRLRWRSLAKPGPGLDKRIGQAQEAVAELARRAWRNRAPDPPPPKKTFDIFAKKRFETNEQHEQRVRNLRAMMAGKTADGASK